MTTNDDQKPMDTTEADSPAGVSCAAAAGSAPLRAVRYPAIRANVMRYYDLCVLVREAQTEMKLLNAQYEDLAADAQNEDAVEWLLSGQDRPSIKEWEDANPKWKVTGNGIRAQKQNAPHQPRAERT